MLIPGLVGNSLAVVKTENTAAAMGSGTLPVYATPALVALMEEAAMRSLLPHLEAGQGSVGVYMEVQHLSATPVGMQVWCESMLSKMEGREMTFTIEARDEGGLIGKAVHKRVLIDEGRFMQKAQGKANPPSQG